MNLEVDFWRKGILPIKVTIKDVIKILDQVSFQGSRTFAFPPGLTIVGSNSFAHVF